MMMNERSTAFRNSSTSSIIITKSAAPPEPIRTPAPAPQPPASPQLPVLRSESSKALLKPTCDVCGKAEKGYMFKCSTCSFQLHPCCAKLSPKMNFTTHQHPLVMFPATATLSGDIQCAECKRKRSGQVYRCRVCDYYLHAVCAKSMVNGLHVNGLKGLDNKGGGNKMLGVAAKLASHVVMGFMGGIVEGIGEGLGEVLTQNLAKGRCNSIKRGSHISG
uniref:Zinc finger PHD-type domain-containing protein n=1 Tax=Opuntia streptacantha TaxID=393608 RepID=A0A7C8ZHV5_OPUST